MRVLPIMNLSVHSRNNIPFMESERLGKSETASSNGISNNIKQLSLLAMLAMSQLNAAAINNSPATVFPKINKTEYVYQNDSTNFNIIGKKEINDDKDFCRFIAYNTDSIKTNVELLGFNYAHNFEDKGYVGIMSGFFQAICPEMTEDNNYLVTFEEVVGDESKGVKTGLVPEMIGKIILKFAENSNKNNNAIDIASKEAFIEAFGEKTINNTPLLENIISKVQYEDGTISEILK